MARRGLSRGAFLQRGARLIDHGLVREPFERQAAASGADFGDSRGVVQEGCQSISKPFVIAPGKQPAAIRLHDFRYGAAIACDHRKTGQHRFERDKAERGIAKFRIHKQVAAFIELSQPLLLDPAEEFDTIAQGGDLRLTLQWIKLRPGSRDPPCPAIGRKQFHRVERDVHAFGFSKAPDAEESQRFLRQSSRQIRPLWRAIGMNSQRRQPDLVFVSAVVMEQFIPREFRIDQDDAGAIQQAIIQRRACKARFVAPEQRKFSGNCLLAEHRRIKRSLGGQCAVNRDGEPSREPCGKGVSREPLGMNYIKIVS